MIHSSLVHRLITAQFPQWQDLPITPIEQGGHDNRTFHLGDTMLVRLPSAQEYAESVAKEQQWLPILAPLLPLPIPIPLGMGVPTQEYPWHWSVYRWLPGETVTQAYESGRLTDLRALAKELAQFLRALEQICPTGGPKPVWRGVSLHRYDPEMQRAIKHLKDRIDGTAITEIWNKALASSWQQKPVWVHGDISAGNLLVQKGRLSAVIDFGGLVVGDPACDLVIAWTLFKGKSRAAFIKEMAFDADTWDRARGWVLWKALITAAKFGDPKNFESVRCWEIIEEVVEQ